MGLGHSPSIVVDGLVFYIDPNNPNCYPGFGNTLYNIVNTSIGGTFVDYTSNPIDNTETRSIFFDGTNDFIPIGSLGSFYTQGTISFWSTSFIRGTTLDNCISIVDEMENLSFHELDSIITRAGENTKILFCGDASQSDLLKANERTGIIDFINILRKMQSFDIIEFGVDDIVRSGLVKEYITAKMEAGF